MLHFHKIDKNVCIRVKTEFVLLAGDLDWGGSWMNLERAIRLLSQVAILKNLTLMCFVKVG